MPRNVSVVTEEDIQEILSEIAAMRVELTDRIEAAEARITALEGEDVPPPPPPPPPPPSTKRKLLGGWRIFEEFARGAIAIDFSRMKLYMTGHAQRNEVKVYSLPAMGQGEDPANWPIVTPEATIAQFWPSSEGYANGLAFYNGKLWASPRVFYDMTPKPTLTLYAQDGERTDVALPRQKFGGFVKTGSNTVPMVGAGGYESGQGTASGPSLGTMDGQQLIGYKWPALPGANLEFWNDRCPREPNYSLDGGGDSWVAWQPRDLGHGLEGRWACDGVWGGGLLLPEGYCYWAWMGIGPLNYSWQSVNFAQVDMNRTYKYVYDKDTHELLGWEFVDDKKVSGQELGPDGKVYLNKADIWSSGLYKVDCALHVYG